MYPIRRFTTKTRASRSLPIWRATASVTVGTPTASSSRRFTIRVSSMTGRIWMRSSIPKIRTASLACWKTSVPVVRVVTRFTTRCLYCRPSMPISTFRPTRVSTAIRSMSARMPWSVSSPRRPTPAPWPPTVHTVGISNGSATAISFPVAIRYRKAACKTATKYTPYSIATVRCARSRPIRP